MSEKENTPNLLRAESRLLEIESASLAPYAQLSSWATRRHELEKEGRQFELRTAFAHDRDRIIHARSFRRLKHKTQVFIPYLNDHQRTRLTHTIEVMQLSRTIARCLGLNEDLTEAIALGHDVGHTPFGHIGERTLRLIMTGKMMQDIVPAKLTEGGIGFKHNAQSLRVVDLLESRYDHPGLNLSDQTREGILKHTTWKKWINFPGLINEGLNVDRSASHFEGQAVAIADEIAQQTHDLEDGMRVGMIPSSGLSDLKIIKLIESKNVKLRDKKLDKFIRQNTIVRSLIHVLVVDVINQSAEKLGRWCKKNKVKSHDDFAEKQGAITECASFSKDMAPLFLELKTFVHEKVIVSRAVQLNDESGQYFVTELFRLYYEDPTMLPYYILERYRQEKNLQHLHQLARMRPMEEVEKEIKSHYQNKPDYLRLICDYIAGMSNTYAIREYEKWVMPFHG